MKKIFLTILLCTVLCLSLPLAASATGAEAATAEQSAFALLYEQLGAHLSEILSALCVLSGLLLAFCYKRGLLPLIKNGLSAIGAATKEWGKSAESFGIEAKQICENANSYVQTLGEKTDEIEKHLLAIEERLKAFEGLCNDSERVKDALGGQMEMLLEIFLSSSLPQFEKDRVSLKLDALKRSIAAPADTEESRA